MNRSTIKSKIGDLSRSHEQRSHDRYYEELSKVRNWNLPKSSSYQSLKTFAGDPLDWPELSRLFTATMHNAKITKREKMYYLKSYVSGKAKQILTVSAMMATNMHGNCCLPQIIFDSQLKPLEKFSIVRIYDSHQFSKPAGVVSAFLSILTNFG